MKKTTALVEHRGDAAARLLTKYIVGTNGQERSLVGFRVNLALAYLLHSHVQGGEPITLQRLAKIFYGRATAYTIRLLRLQFSRVVVRGWEEGVHVLVWYDENPHTRHPKIAAKVWNREAPLELPVLRRQVERMRAAGEIRRVHYKMMQVIVGRRLLADLLKS